MKKYIYYFIAGILLLGCSNNIRHDKKTTFIFDFDDTISTTAISMEMITIAANYDPVKIKNIKELIERKKPKNHVGPITYLLIDDIVKILGKNITRSDFNMAAKNVINNKITPGIKQSIQNIINSGDQVLIIGGGYGTCDAIVDVAKSLSINPANVFSGIASFDKNDNFTIINDRIGFFNCMTGKKITDKFIKSQVISELKQQGLINGKVIHIGDGTNDLEVWNADQVDLFIGFGINKVELKVKDGAPVFVENIKDFNRYINQNL